ncbi:hypothetical protein QUF58_07435 [Anaerolineales bacterium HSG24]|nr:hypothetical protein [Anaerolineales bacterium HSG24]
MAYGDFDLEKLQKEFDLVEERAWLFDKVVDVEPTEWLKETLRRSQTLAVVSEKARSEMLVTPILLEARQLNQERFAIYSGTVLDADKEKGLSGECDFILTDTPPRHTLQAPIITLVEAKKQDIERYLGQCAAQMLGARVFNQTHQNPVETIFGCVTTGEAWQFLKLDGLTIYVDLNRYYINQVGQILGALQAVFNFYISDSPFESSDG